MSLTITGRLGLYIALLTVLLAAGLLILSWWEDARVVADGGTEVPAAPTGLSVATEQGSLNVSPDWDEVEGADDYLVRWRPKDGQLNDGVRVTSSSAAITVDDYGRWVMRVRACNEAGCGKPVARQFEVEPVPEPTPEPTPESTPEPAPEPPAKPAGLRTFTKPGSLRVAVDWNDAPQAATYAVRWRKDAGDGQLSKPVSVTESQAAITVADYGDWVVRVQACNDAGCSPARSTRFQVKATVPAKPSGLQVAAQADPLEFVASWSAVGEATHYRLKWQKAGPRSKGTLGEAQAKTTSAAIRVTQQGQWLIQVEACNDAGCGPGLVRRFAVVPGRPAGLRATPKAGSLQVSVDWADVHGASYYWVRWRGADAGDGLNEGVKVRASEAVITVADYGDWVVRVEACLDDVGCGPRAKQTATVAPSALSLAPKLDDENQLLPRTFTASWVAASDVSSYTLRWKLAEANFQDEDKVSADAEATTADFTVSEDGEYEVELRGESEDGHVALTSTTMQVYSYRPGHLSLHHSGRCHVNKITGIEADPVNNGVEVRWNNPNDATITKYQYQIQRGNSYSDLLDEWTDADGTDAATTSYTVTGIANGEIHSVWLRAVASNRTYCLDTFIYVTPSDPTIGPITGYEAELVADQSGQVKLSWDDPDDSSLDYDLRFWIFHRPGYGPGRGAQPWTTIDEADITSADGRLSTTLTEMSCPWGYSFVIRSRRGAAIGPLSPVRHVVFGIYLTESDDTRTVAAGESECIFGRGGNDTLTGAAGQDWLYGDAGQDTLNGAEGFDWLYGGGGSDTLYGGGGNDHLEGETGDDVLWGGDGDDRMYAGAGNDEMHGGAGNDDMLSGADNDEIYGDQGDDRLAGSLGNDQIYGGENDDTLWGGDGNDALWGGKGDDTLYGGWGNDTLHGGEGDDELYGGDGRGDDTLRGEAGDDAFYFYFYEGFGNDTITDYALGASQADSEKIYLCMGDGTNLATHSGADSGSDRVITVTFDGATAGTITLKGITSGSANFANLNIIAAAAGSAECSF